MSSETQEKDQTGSININAHEWTVTASNIKLNLPSELQAELPRAGALPGTAQPWSPCCC